MQMIIDIDGEESINMKIESILMSNINATVWYWDEERYKTANIPVSPGTTVKLKVTT